MKSKSLNPKLLPLRLRLWRNSQTQLWAGVQESSAAVLALIPAVNSFLNSPEFNKLLGTLTVPWYVPTGIAAFGVITYLAHGHDA